MSTAHYSINEMPRNYSSSPERLALALVLSLIWGAALAQPGPRPAPSLRTIAPLANDRALGFFVDDDAAAGADAELCKWALEDWVEHAEGRLVTTPAEEAVAVIRVYFISPGAGRYGEMRPILVGGRRGAEVYVRTETDSLGPDIAAAARQDPLMRETIVYLTCLHEIGHALGMAHTDVFDDVMYFFGFGGDIVEFFGRYRSRLAERGDISGESGLSTGDVDQLLAAYPGN